MIAHKVGSMLQCASIRSTKKSGEQCTSRAQAGTQWCGKHKSTQLFFTATAATATAPPTATATPAVIEHVTDYRPEDRAAAAKVIYRSWIHWLARRAGPLLWFRDESNNPNDFFSCEPVKTIPLRDVISFVSGDKGYIMDIKSATSLIDHAKKAGEGEVPLNPFNRSPLPAIFLKRVLLHKRSALRPSIPPPTEGMSDLQKLAQIGRAHV
jgi:hypothetical protein